jgi:Mrp family chromosome partitioning ATPase
MAKVYDALRRAEEERKRRAGAGEAPLAPLAPAAAEPAPAHRMPAFASQPAPEPRGKTGFWRRLLAWRERGATGESALDGNKRRITLLQPESFVAEQFRTLRGRIDAMAANQALRTIVVTSPNPGDGKTTAAINLATVTALSLGRRVLLVDCDLRKPKVHLALGLRPEAGLGR